jgi:hypothetical protein
MSRRIREWRPSAGLLVAVLALVAAIAGTAVAGPGATTSKLTKKKVVKIAGQEIKKLAPGLSVAHADTATSATTADSAAQAENADLLDGVDSAGFQQKCATGAIRGSVVIDGSASFPSTYTNQSGFNCSGGAIKARRDTGGGSTTYYVRFEGNPAEVAVGNAFLVADNAFAVQYITIARAKDSLDGLMSFRVAVCDPFGGNCVSDQSFVLVVL